VQVVLCAPRAVAVALLCEDHVSDFPSHIGILVESAGKILLTGVLAFIEPGSNGQVVAGLFLTFILLLNYANEVCLVGAIETIAERSRSVPTLPPRCAGPLR
jgi:hypothetical protein